VSSKIIITFITLITSLLSSCYDIHEEPEGFFHQDAFYRYSGEKEIGPWTQGKRNGYFKIINSDRKLLSKGNYTMGVQEGEWQYFHPNGNLNSKGVFINGTRTGQWEYYYTNNQIKELRSFANGNNYLLFSWNPEGKEMVVDGTGPYQFYFKDVLREAGEYKDGLPSGDWKIYQESGELEREFTVGQQ